MFRQFIFLLGIIAVSSCLEEYVVEDTRFPNWKGELPSTVAASFHDKPSDLNSADLGEVGNSTHQIHYQFLYSVLIRFLTTLQELWDGKISVLSWTPRITQLHNFLTDEECEYLKNVSHPFLEPAVIVDRKTGKNIVSSYRSNTGTFLTRRQDPIVARVERRIAQVTMIPEQNGEGLQILKYVDGQQYGEHTDYFDDAWNADPSLGGQRVATMLMYLSTPGEGGETVFPYAQNRVSGPEWSDCALKGFAAKPVKGNALLFYNLKTDGQPDKASTHASCPTWAGEKWVATKWLRQGPYVINGQDLLAHCQDGHERCVEWAEKGECESNPLWMIQNCRRSCRQCSVLKYIDP